MIKVSIIVPVYNEFASLREVLKRVIDAPLPANCRKEIIVVDDGSTDGTSALLKDYRESDVVVVHHSVLNFGKGTAVRVGLAIATGDIVLIQDGDLEYDPNEYPKLIEPIISGEADVVYGSRFIQGPKNMRWANWLANKMLTTAANVLFRAGITDEATAYKAFRKDVLNAVSLKCRRFEFCPEVTAKLRRLSVEIKEVPISYNARGVSEGKKIKARDGFEALWTLVKYRVLPVRHATVPTSMPTDPKALCSGASAAIVSCLLPLLIWSYFTSEPGRRLPYEHLASTYINAVVTLAKHLPENNWLLPRYALQSLLISFGMFFTDLAFGAWLLACVSRKTSSRLSPVLYAATSLALGSGIASSLMFVIASAHALTRSAVLLLTICFGVVGILGLFWTHSWRPLGRSVRAFRFWSNKHAHGRLFLVIALSCLAPCMVLHAFDLMVPVIEFDSSMYHMAAAKLYKETHSLPFHDGIRFNAEPQLPNLLYVRQWLILEDDALLKLANVEFAAIIMLLLLYVSRRIRWKEGASVGLLFLCISPAFLWIAKIEYADFILSGYFAVATVFLAEQLLRPRRCHVWLAGAMLGFAAASKFQGMLLVIIALCSFSVCWLFARLPLHSLMRRLIIMGALIVAAGLGWWMRSYLNTGTPVYPFMASGPMQGDQAALLAHTKGLGLGHSFITLAMMPYSVAMVTSYRFGDEFGLGLPLLIVVILLALSWTSNGGVSTNRVMSWFMVLVFGGYFVFWFYSAQVLRYLATLLPVLAIVLMMALRRIGSKRLPLVILICFLPVAVHSSLMTSTTLRHGLMPPVTYDAKEQYLLSTLPFYGAVKVLNASAHRTDRVYALFGEASRFYLAPENYGDWFGKYGYSWLSKNSGSLDKFTSSLRAAHFSHVLLNRDAMKRQGAFLYPDISSALASGHSLPGMRLLYCDESYALYRME